MRDLLFAVASAAALAMANPATAQMYLPPSPGVTGPPSYTPPSYAPTPPGYTPPGSTAPNYSWREQRANDDWRNNTWREQRINEDWRSNNWRQERANEDWRQREDDAKTRTPNNTVDRGYINDPTDSAKNKIGTQGSQTEKDCGVRSVGSPKPCSDNTQENAKIIVPPRDAKIIVPSTDAKIIVPPRGMTKINPIDTKTSPNNKGYLGGR
jgi:hypothetical protein